LTQLGLYAQLPVGEDGLILGELAFSPSDDRLAFATDIGALVVWDMATYNPLYTFETAEREQGVAYPDVAFAPPAGQYLGANGNAFLDQYAEYWGVALQWTLPITETEDLEAGTVISPTILAGTSHWAKTGVTYTPDGGRLVVGTREGMGGGGSVKVWASETGESLLDISTLEWITDVVVSPDGSTIVGTSYGQVLLWDTVSGDEKFVISIIEGPLWGLGLSPNGRLLAVWGGSTVYLVDQFSGTVVYQLEGESEIVSAVFTPNGRMLISADGDTIRFWDVASYQLLSTLQLPEPIVALAISANGRSLAIGTAEGVVYLWGILNN
jgi:WD40 repeat protein